MISIINKISFLILLTVVFAVGIFGQEIVACAYIDRLPRNEPMPENVRERMIKLCIEENKKEFKRLVTRSEQVAKLSEEIETSYSENKKLSSDDRKKLKKVEKLLKKIRKELRANNDKGDDDEDEKPSSTLHAIKDLQKTTTKLLNEIKKTTRHTISAAAIQSSNAVFKLVKFLRFRK